MAGKEVVRCPVLNVGMTEKYNNENVNSHLTSPFERLEVLVIDSGSNVKHEVICPEISNSVDYGEHKKICKLRSKGNQEVVCYLNDFYNL